MGTATAVAGLFDTAEEAAVWLAVVKRDMKAHHNGKLIAPPKIDKPHKPRAKPAVPAVASPLPLQPPQLPMTMAMTMTTAVTMTTTMTMTTTVAMTMTMTMAHDHDHDVD